MARGKCSLGRFTAGLVVFMSNFFMPVRGSIRLCWLGFTLAALMLSPLVVSAAAPLPGAGASSPRSLADLRAAAEKGDVFAQRVLANAYLTGEGVPKDAAEGVRWVRAAANQRDPIAQYILGTLYDQGEGVTADLREAVKWYELAAAQGLADAQYNVGLCYLKGEGVLKDTRKAFDWFRKAADQGDARSQCNVGLAYINGNGVEKNLTEAVSWLRKAAYPPGEDARAQFLLGRLFQLGEGVTQDLAAATKWIGKSAQQNYASAQFDFGRALLVGEGIERNEVEGRAWIEKAAAQGHELARQHIAQSGRPAALPTNVASAATRPLAPPPFTGARDAGIAPPASNAFAPSPLPTNVNTAVAMRDPLPATPALPAPGKAMEPFTPAKLPSTETTGREAGLPPFTAPSATKETVAAAPTPDLFKLPSATADTNAPGAGSLLNDPPRPSGPSIEPRAREGAAPVAPHAAEGGGNVVWMGYLLITIALVILFLGIYVVVVFKGRLQSLEAELKKAQFELSKANVNLSSMMHQVEQLALMAPPTAPKTSLPEWNPEPARSHTGSFKMNRSK